MKIGVVIVTYNRLEKLKVTLDLFEKQTSSFEYIVVVNNASTDGTTEFLNEWQNIQSSYHKYLITTEKNLGGSGGFYLGLEKASSLDADWIWVSDDDAYPEADVMEKAYKYLECNKNKLDSIAAICCKVMNNNRIDCVHRSKIVNKGFRIIRYNSTEDDYKKDEFEINAFSYVGTIINKFKLQQAGLTNRDYFIWYDDTEHSLRLSKTGSIIVVPEIVVHHNLESKSGILTWKNYYGTRNLMDMYRRHFPKLCYNYEFFVLKSKCVINLLLHRNYDRVKMYLKALEDSKKERLGIDELYKPGWKK